MHVGLHLCSVSVRICVYVCFNCYRKVNTVVYNSNNNKRSWSPVHTGDKVKFNTVDFVESLLFPKLATKSTVANTFNSVAGFGNISATAWNRQLVAVDFVAECGQLCCHCVRGQSDTVDFVDLNKIDRVEFNFVASVYRTLENIFYMLWCALWLDACCELGVDIGQQRSVDCAAWQSASAAVRRETGEDCSFHDQREVTDVGGSG